jgi:hypothetical protein
MFIPLGDQESQMMPFNEITGTRKKLESFGNNIGFRGKKSERNISFFSKYS